VANSAQPIALPNPFAAGCAWIDGKYVPIGEACIPILDTGFVRSDLTYDVAAVWEGRFFRRAHWSNCAFYSYDTNSCGSNRRNHFDIVFRAVVTATICAQRCFPDCCSQVH